MTKPNRRAQMIAATVAASVAVSVAGAGAAAADPTQGGTEPSAPSQQGGTQPSGPTEQGGTTPTPAPAPAPEPVSPVSPGQPGIAPAPPSTSYDDAGYSGGGQYSETYQPPQYSEPYSVVPSAPLHAPKPTPPVAPKPWKADTLTVGNAVIPVKQLPKQLQDNPKAIVSINDWSAYTESEIARRLISIGVPRDEAIRQAASATIGAVAGGAALGAVSFTTTAVVVGVLTIPLSTLVGAGIGAGVGAAVPAPVPGNPASIGAGAAIGAGVGLAGSAAATAAAATAAGVAGTVTGAVIGGALAWALGAGDPGVNKTAPANPFAPERPQQEQKPSTPPPPPVQRPSGDNQFEAHAPNKQADYVVAGNGDVNVSVNVGGRQMSASWTAAQADAPYQAFGAAAPEVKRQVNEGTHRALTAAERMAPGLTVLWAKPKH